MLKIESFTKKYGEKCAVDDLSLHLRPGEICAFIGHNGAGKTTTLKACVGLIDFDAGDILIDGVSIKEDPIQCKRNIAYIPDNPDLYDFMTGMKYLNFIADVFGVDTDVRAERIASLAESFGLASELPKPIGTYSHGMKQKLALIGAWLHAPKLILMDEPFVGLDPKASFTLKEMMKRHCAEGGAIFFSTHVLDVAEKLCDRVAIIQRGKLVVVGNMDEIRGSESLEEVFLELEAEDA